MPLQAGSSGQSGLGLEDFGSRGGGQSVERVPPLFPKIEA